MSDFRSLGATPQKQPKYVPLFIDKEFTGLYTQRAALHDPSDLVMKSYGGRPDALLAGNNIELTNNLTLKRRPGLSGFSLATYPTAPNRAFAFTLLNGTVRVIIDTGSSGALTVTSVATSSGGSAVYTGTFPLGGSNAYVGLKFVIAGFATTPNNGTFVCTASTTTTLTLTTSTAVSETIAATATTYGGVWYDTQAGGVKTLLFAKGSGAGQSHFVAVAGVMYVGDGVETWKYTPTNTNGTVWNWGIDTPTQAPTATIEEAGDASASWLATTWFSTMGLIVDSTGNIEQILSIEDNSPTGLGGNGQPVWNQTVGGTTVDGTAVWVNIGLLEERLSSHLYGHGPTVAVGQTAVMYDSITGCAFFNFRPGGASGTTQGSRPPLPNITGSAYRDDGTVDWACAGNHNFQSTGINGWSPLNVWRPSTAYGVGAHIVEPADLPLAPGIPISGVPRYIQEITTAGTTAATGSSPSWSTTLNTIGQITTDGEITWRSLGSATWTAGRMYTAWTGPSSTFSAVVDANNSIWVCITGGTAGSSTPFVAPNVWQAAHAYSVGDATVDTNSNKQVVSVAGTSGGSAPTWDVNKGDTTTDNTVTWVNLGSAYGNIIQESTGVRWVNVGKSSTWAAGRTWYKPAQGWFPPGPSTPYGSPSINDGTNIEFVVQTGVSGSLQPTWGTSEGNETIDSGAVWVNDGPFLQNSMAWSTGFQYAYSFEARTSDDYYNTHVPPLQINVLGTPTGSMTGAVSTASPLLTISGGNAGAVITLTGLGSTDPQVDTIDIWRTTDGGATLFFLTKIPNPTPIGGTPGVWTLDDYMQDEAVSDALPGLNIFIEAPIDNVNDPPPDAFLPMVYNFQRIWGSVGSEAIFSGGPDTLVGNPAEAFSPSDEFPFLSSVIRIVKTSQGLVVFLPNSIEFIGGGPQKATFFSVTLAPGIGMLSFNALDIYAGEIYFFTADSQFKVMSPTLNIQNAGFPLGDQFASWDASTVYVSVQQAGTDNCMMVANGTTGWYRLNPRQVPGSLSGPEPIWSPFATITGGCKMVQSVEVSPGIKKLLVGATTGGQVIRQRDLTLYTDVVSGVATAYNAQFTMGSIVLAHPGELAVLKFLEADFSGVSYQPTISFLLNEISGTFTSFTAAPQFDPPSLYGNTITPSSYSPNRYYFSGVAAPVRCRHLQIKVDLGTNSTGSEIYNMTIFGRLMVEV